MDRRRLLLKLLAGALAAPLAVQAQQKRTIPVVGILHDRPAGPSAIIRTLQEELRRLGYVDGQTIKFEVRFAGGRREDLANLAQDLVQRRIDVIYVVGAAPLKAARDATSIIPIVAIALEIDPVTAGYARSVAQPGGNVTGCFSTSPHWRLNGCSSSGQWFQELTLCPFMSPMLSDQRCDHRDRRDGSDERIAV
jgi:putative tryptophan/tyrosine transport system substrate-binding protein